jgi:excisionase family DNA binding protein
MGEERQGADEVMNYKELAAYLKTSEGTLRHDVMDRRIPFIKIGARVRFSKKEIDKWLEERSRRAAGRVKRGNTGMGKHTGELFSSDNEG